MQLCIPYWCYIYYIILSFIFVSNLWCDVGGFIRHAPGRHCLPFCSTTYCIFVYKNLLQIANSLQCLTTLVCLNTVSQCVGDFWEKTNSIQVIHSAQGRCYLAQMFDCHSTCLCNLASHLESSSRNINKMNIHHICPQLMSWGQTLHSAHF